MISVIRRDIVSLAHLPLQPRCGACADTIFPHERVIALSGNKDSTACESTRPFIFPQQGGPATVVDDRHLCRVPGCDACASAPEFAAVHHDCYEIYKHHMQSSQLELNEALHRLWIVATWRGPWPKARLIYLTQTPVIDQVALKTVSERCKIPELSNIPLELVERIRQFSPHELLWRAVVVIRLAACLSTNRSRPLLTIPLDTILSWERGGELLCIPPGSQRWVRLTVDLDGISKVERLDDRPKYDGTTTQRLAFVVESPTGINTEIKNELLRLSLPHRQLRVWNTPAPPEQGNCLIRRTPHVPWQRLHAVDLNRICGITFFFVSGEIYGIYIHHSEISSAMDICERLWSHHRRLASWAYMPIAPRDQIIMLGTRVNECGVNILVRTQLSGDIILGPLAQPTECDRLFKGDQITLIYGEPDDPQPVSIFGASCPPSTEGADFPIPTFRKPRLVPGRACFSTAPLQDVSRARMFYDPDTWLCRGILLWYENGGSRAVGQCRVHVDDSTTVDRPTRLCFQATTYLTSKKWVRPGVRVRFGRDGDGDGAHRHSDEAWKCRPLDGILTVFFTHDSFYLEVEESLV